MKRSKKPIGRRKQPAKRKAPVMSRGSQDNTQTNDNTKQPTKCQRVMRALMERSYNRFEASRELSDWCLHSTVAELELKGILVEREWEDVRGIYGPVHCKRYWIPKSEFKRVRKCLDAA